MSKFVPSEYQKKIFKFILKGKGNAVVSAVAGSGKTTTLLKALEIIPKDKNVLFLAFNKSIADELKTRVPQTNNITVKTVHGFGYGMLARYYGSEIDNGKYRKLFYDFVDYFRNKKISAIEKYKFTKEQLSEAKKMLELIQVAELKLKPFVTDVISLVNLGRLHLIDMAVMFNGVNDLKNVADKHTIDYRDNQCEVAWYLISLGITYTDMIDYTDMIYIPIWNELKSETYDMVFVDECQDLSSCQRLLMKKAMDPENGRFIAVGDPGQAIYAFAGADDLSYKKLCEIENTIELPLSITYRCATQIVDLVHPLNPYIKALPKNNKGVIDRDASYLHVKDGDMVVCRQMFPVVSLCIKFLKQNKKSYIIGSDIGMSLISMINNADNKIEFTMSKVLSKLFDDKEKLIVKLMETEKYSRIDATECNSVVILTEKIDVIVALAEGIEDPNIVIDKIKKIFSNQQKSGICLSTIHKAKGLEADRVFVLHPELMPSRYAKLEWELKQEDNLKYVAYTRAKTHLGFITDFDAFKRKKNIANDIEPHIESKHIGAKGMKMKFDVRVIKIRHFNGIYGDSVLYEMVDKDSNVLNKFGDIHNEFLKNSEAKEIDIGSELSFYGIIKEHDEFNGRKITKLGKITKH